MVNDNDRSKKKRGCPLPGRGEGWVQDASKKLHPSKTYHNPVGVE
jgi:hypothetical protein